VSHHKKSFNHPINEDNEEESFQDSSKDGEESIHIRSNSNSQMQSPSDDDSSDDENDSSSHSKLSASDKSGQSDQSDNGDEDESEDDSLMSVNTDGSLCQMMQQ